MAPHEAHRNNRSIPPCTVMPVLAYPDVRVAVEWLGRAFGFVERLRIGDHRAQLMFGGGAVVATDGGAAAPATGHATHSVLVRVTHIDRHHDRARDAGARILQTPTDHPYGERQYTAEDCGGHHWTFSESIADVDPKDWGGELFEV
jgi:uncharacterized glyoxalase superfamily protein PhnB